MSVFDDAFRCYADLHRLVGICDETLWKRLGEKYPDVRGTEPMPTTLLWLFDAILREARS